MDAALVGRCYPFAEPYLVGVEKIREFATAIGEDKPACHDRAAARAAGYRDLIAPPTFAMAVTARAQDAVLFDPALGLDFDRVVHRDQRFSYTRPITAGDELRSIVVIESIKVLAGNDVLGLRVDVTDADGVPVCTTQTTLVARSAS